MKKIVCISIVALMLVISSRASAFYYGSVASDVAGVPLLVTFSGLTPWDILITRSELTGTFVKTDLPPYNITTFPLVMTAWLPGWYYHSWIYTPPSTSGWHCVRGKHRFYYFSLFGYSYYSPIDCVLI